MERAEGPGMDREQRLRRWIEENSDMILRTCYLCLSDRGLAEDATQDTWIKAWKHIGDFERSGIVNEKAWLLRIAVNTCKDYRRTAWFRHVDRKQALEDLPPRLIAVEPEDHTLTLTVMDMPDRYKQVILLYYVILPGPGDLPEETARSRLIAAIREKYGDDLPLEDREQFEVCIEFFDVEDEDGFAWILTCHPRQAGAESFYTASLNRAGFPLW